MPRVGGRRKKTKSHRQYDEQAEENIPKTFVFKRGKVSDTFKDIVKDTRKCFYPNTAMRLQDSQKLKLSAYVRSSKHYGVTHLVAYHTRNNSTIQAKLIFCFCGAENYVRFIKNDGPVLTFKIVNYCRGRDVQAEIPDAQPFLQDFNSPLLVMNNFSHQSVKGLAPLIQSMFPPLNMEVVKPEHLRRVISFTYKPENGCIYFRHYRIKMMQTGLSDAMKGVINDDSSKHSQMNLSGYRTFSDFLLKRSPAKQSQSVGEAEEEEVEEGIQSSGAGKIKHTAKLHEIGPRLKLKFFRYDQKLNIKEDPVEQQQANPEANQDQNMEVENEVQDGQEVQEVLEQNDDSIDQEV